MVRLVNSYFTSLPGRGILSWEEKIMNRKNVLWELFVSTLYLSAFTFGGGYVIVTLMKQKFVDELHWIEEDEMLDLIAIAQSAPGAIAVNGAIVVGYKLAGLLGAIVAIIATIIPPFVIITVISYFYELFRDNFIVSKLLSGMQAGVGAVIASVVWDMGGGVLKQKSAVSDFILVAAFLAACVLRVNVVYIVLACIAPYAPARTHLQKTPHRAAATLCAVRYMGSFLRYSFPGRLPKWNFGSVPWMSLRMLLRCMSSTRRHVKIPSEISTGFFVKTGVIAATAMEAAMEDTDAVLVSAATTAKTAKALKNTRQSSISATATAVATAFPPLKPK